MPDEITIALDEATACRILNNLRSMTDVILVTHRTEQASVFDKALFSLEAINTRERGAAETYGRAGRNHL